MSKTEGILLYLCCFIALGASINNCEFAYSYSDSFEQFLYGHMTDYDPVQDKYYMVNVEPPIVIQFDKTGTVLGSFQVSGTFILNGVIVFSAGGKAWIYGQN